MTALDLIKGSLRLLGALATGETPPASEAQEALSALNDMVDAWGTEGLMVYTSQRALFPLTGLKGAYQIGPAATAPDWNAPRPLMIDEAALVVSGVEYPLHIIDNEREWAAVRMKGLTSALPTELYYEMDYPSGTVNLWPVPTVSGQVALYVPLAVAQFATLATPLALPPGYNRALRYNLAVELAPEWGREAALTVIAPIAQDAKDNIKRNNLQLAPLRVEPALRGGGGRWNWLTGSSSR